MQISQTIMLKPILVLLLIQYSVCDIENTRLDHPPGDVSLAKINPKSSKDLDTVAKISEQGSDTKPKSNEVDDKQKIDVVEKPKTHEQNKDPNAVTPKPVDKKPEVVTADVPDKNLTLSSAALLRAFYVFAGLSAAVLIYIGFKTIRVTKPPSDNTTVRKYGVTARRGDLEMLPLPLAEDDDDDTLFDVGTIPRGGNSSS